MRSFAVLVVLVAATTLAQGPVQPCRQEQGGRLACSWAVASSLRPGQWVEVAGVRLRTTGVRAAGTGVRWRGRGAGGELATLSFVREGGNGRGGRGGRGRGNGRGRGGGGGLRVAGSVWRPNGPGWLVRTDAEGRTLLQRDEWRPSALAAHRAVNLRPPVLPAGVRGAVRPRVVPRTRRLGASGQADRLRILVFFDKQGGCTAEERAIASTMESTLESVWQTNMNITDYELVYTCGPLTPVRRSMPELSRMAFFNAAQHNLEAVRSYWGGDLAVVVGNFTVTTGGAGDNRAGGDMGPNKWAVTGLHSTLASDPLALVHELAHNSGMRHDRWNAFSNQGTFYCETSASQCSFGYADNTYMTIMSYGTNAGGCPAPTPSVRVMVYSGYPHPDDPSKILGTPCGSNSSAWNRKVIEDNWGIVKAQFSSESCPQVSCPTPPPPQGCVCVGSDTPPPMPVQNGLAKVKEDYSDEGWQLSKDQLVTWVSTDEHDYFAFIVVGSKEGWVHKSILELQR